MKYVHQYDCNTPCTDESENHEDSDFELFAYTEKAVVEEEDGDFDERDADSVEYLIGNCGLGIKVSGGSQSTDSNKTYLEQHVHTRLWNSLKMPPHPIIGIDKCKSRARVGYH